MNHLAWLTELWLEWRRLYPLLRDRGRLPEVLEQDPVRFELMYHLGRFPTEAAGT